VALVAFVATAATAHLVAATPAFGVAFVAFVIPIGRYCWT
jgi:hypothetical protein